MYAEKVKTMTGVVLIAIVLLIVYSNSFSGVWCLDDFPNIINNPNVHPESLTLAELSKSMYGMDSSHAKISRPLAYLTFAINYYAGGDNVFGYHAVNFLIHAAASFFLFLFTRELFLLPSLRGKYQSSATVIALIATLLWASHPIQVTAVTYIVQRMASLAGMFFLMGMYFYLMARTGNGAHKASVYAIFSGICFLLAMASKENAAIFPAVLLLLEFAFFYKRKQTRKWLVAGSAGLVLLLVGFGAYYFDLNSLFTSGYNERPYTATERLLTQPRVILFYVYQIIYPVSSSFTLLHDFSISESLISPVSTIFSLGFIVPILAVSGIYARRIPIVFFSVTFFMITHFIESSFLPLEIIFEHRNYLPGISIFILMALAGYTAFDHFKSNIIRFMIFFLFGILFVTQSHTTYMRNRLFQDDLLLWSDNVSKSPNLHRPTLNLGRALVSKGEYSDGLALMKLSLTKRNAARKDQKFITHYNLAIFYHTFRQYDQALYHLGRVLDYHPEDPKIYQRMAHLYVKMGEIENAEKYIRLALLKDPAEIELQKDLQEIEKIKKAGDTPAF